jgi:RNA polymerase-binding protein DksA
MDTIAIESALRTRRAELLRRHAAVEAHLRRDGEGLVADWTEAAQQRFNDEVLEGLEEAERHELEAIHEALRRIADGSYGRCEACGEVIPEARLRAIPTASRCVDCAEA